MNLFMSGNFLLHSGQRSNWKINSLALSERDLATLALMAAPKLRPFTVVKGIVRGGVAFSQALQPYYDLDANTLLIVDDVCTTGDSFEQERERRMKADNWTAEQIHGVCIFARGPCPDWVKPIFTLSI